MKVFHVNLNIACLRLPHNDDDTLDVTDHWMLDNKSRARSITDKQTLDDETASALKLDDNQGSHMADVFRRIQESD